MSITLIFDALIAIIASPAGCFGGAMVVAMFFVVLARAGHFEERR